MYTAREIMARQAAHEPKMPACARNDYGALLSRPAWCDALMREAETEGAWTTGIESDKRQRGSAINADLYGYDEKRGLAVVQVREAVFHPKRHTRVRKDYYLIGHNENGSFFAHPVDSPARSRKALETPESAVAYVLAKIWNVKPDQLDEIVRQGDVAFIPVPRLPVDVAELPAGETILRDTHELKGDLWRDSDGTLYTRRGARMRHTKGQHKPIRARYGYYRVQEGVRAETWGFTVPTAD